MRTLTRRDRPDKVSTARVHRSSDGSGYLSVGRRNLCLQSITRLHATKIKNKFRTKAPFSARAENQRQLRKCTYIHGSAVTSLIVTRDLDNYSRQHPLFVQSVASIEEIKFREVIKHTNCVFLFYFALQQEMHFHFMCLRIPTLCSHAR